MLRLGKRHRPCFALRLSSPLYVSVRNYAQENAEYASTVEELQQRLKIRRLVDWYSVSEYDVIHHGGWPLLKVHSTLNQMLRSAFPDFPWKEEKFVKPKRAPKGYWSNVANQKVEMERIGAALGVKELDGWYSISRKQVNRSGGSGLFQEYSSLSHALRTLYPSYPWQIERFVDAGHTPFGHWKDEANLLGALRRAETKIGIQQATDWYSVTLVDLKQVGFPVRIGKTGIVNLITQLHPNHKWDTTLLFRGKYSQQRRLEKCVASIFPGIEIISNARKQANVINPKTGDYLELDLYLPTLKLAFEYQEIHHYTSVYKPVDRVQERDQMKKELAQLQGITVVTIPCWWNGTQESIIAAVKKSRPDLLTDKETDWRALIPDKPPPGFLQSKTINIEDIGEPCTAYLLTQVNTDPTNWLMFEKYDGIRGFWNPIRRAFYSRYGNRFSNIPEQIINAMPENLFLDGEFWFGRDSFQEAMKISGKANAETINWTNFKYVVYDVPKHPGTYQERHSLLERHFDSQPCKYVEVAQACKCEGIAHVERFFQDVVDKGGEGIILRDPNALYEPGRSRGYLKHKKFRDAEAKVIKDLGNQQWLCELPNGVTFIASAGTAELLKRWKVQEGDIVSFKHSGFLLGTKTPKFPLIYRVRKDISWDEVLNGWKDIKPSLAPRLRQQVSSSPFKKPKGYWRERANRRAFFSAFAAAKEFDPLKAENWTKERRKELREMYPSHLSYFGGKLKAALEDAFPELKLEETNKKPQRYWSNIANCRAFFDEFAQENHFDPLDPTNWYDVDAFTLKCKLGGHAILTRHDGMRNALQKAYPEIEFTKWTGLGTPSSKRHSPERLREFFEGIAKEKGFDSSDPENWYSMTRDDLRARKGGKTIQHKLGLKYALCLAYPELSFSRWKVPGV